MSRFPYVKKDLNRYSKTYPYIRSLPRYVYEFQTYPGDSTVEAGKITFSDSDTETYTFTGTYTTAPVVVISTVDSTSSGDTNVAITVSSISTTTAIVKASFPFTGQVHIHVAAV